MQKKGGEKFLRAFARDSFLLRALLLRVLRGSVVNLF
jgi:hypothetical protein